MSTSATEMYENMLYDSTIWSDLGSQEGKILVAGLDNSGKSTMMQRIRNIEELGKGPTHSKISEELRIGRTVCTTLSVGRELPWPWWFTNDYLSDVLGVMFVVDAIDHQRLREASREIQCLVRHLPDVPFVILGNKIDHPDAVLEWQLDVALGMFDPISLLLDAPVTLKMCSILNRQGYQEAFKWLIERI